VHPLPGRAKRKYYAGQTKNAKSNTPWHFDVSVPAPFFKGFQEKKEKLLGYFCILFALDILYHDKRG